jgi:hypothetical protein
MKRNESSDDDKGNEWNDNVNDYDKRNERNDNDFFEKKQK